MRRLFIVPIVHSAEDLGRLGKQLLSLKSLRASNEIDERSGDCIARFWQEMRMAIMSWDVSFSETVVYQDALPVSVGPRRLEMLIVAEMAKKGSANHQLLQWMIERGADVLGTESPDLLVAEYTIVRDSLSDPNARLDSPLVRAKLAELLERRDQYIAERIHQTLPANRTGVIFLGMLHNLSRFLPGDIDVSYPFGLPSLRDTSRTADGILKVQV